jgi:hypothetical protein
VIPCVLVLALWATSADAARYNPRRAGHPLRIAAYALYPVGVLIDYAIFRPAWWLVQNEPYRSLFGAPVAPEADAQSLGDQFPSPPSE